MNTHAPVRNPERGFEGNGARDRGRAPRSSQTSCRPGGAGEPDKDTRELGPLDGTLLPQSATRPVGDHSVVKKKLELMSTSPPPATSPRYRVVKVFRGLAGHTAQLRYRCWACTGSGLEERPLMASGHTPASLHLTTCHTGLQVPTPKPPAPPAASGACASAGLPLTENVWGLLADIEGSLSEL